MSELSKRAQNVRSSTGEDAGNMLAKGELQI